MGEDRLLSSIKYRDLDAYVTYLIKTRTNRGRYHQESTINRKVAAISKLFRYATHLDYLVRSPLDGKKSLLLKSRRVITGG